MKNETIQNMLNKPYPCSAKQQNRKYVCWSFCRDVYSVLGLKLPRSHQQKYLVRLKQPQLNCIVLFHAVVSWHSGVVWPDTLHFIHACPINIFDENPKAEDYIVQQDRLTIWPYTQLIEGFYTLCENKN